MSSEPDAKRRKMVYKKHAYSLKPKNLLEAGIKGFIATCNFREKDCVRECYNLLNEYADQKPSDIANVELQTDAIAGEQSKDDLNDSGAVAHGGDDDDDDDDIASQLEKEIKSAQQGQKTNRNRFQQVETKVPNCIFIKTTIDNPNELGVRIIRDIAETQTRKTRMLLRFMPVDVVCRSNVESIKNAAGQLFDKVFLHCEPTTFAIVVNKRYNNDADRMEIIRELAEMVSFKNSLHKVDLKNAKLTVVVEIVRGLCCLSILPDFVQLKKFNVSELTNVKDDKEAKESKEADTAPKTSDDDTRGAKEAESTEPVASDTEDAENIVEPGTDTAQAVSTDEK